MKKYSPLVIPVLISSLALAPLTGQPVQLVLDELGRPSSCRPAGGETVYEWRRTRLVHGPALRPSGMPPNETSGGYAGGRYRTAATFESSPMAREGSGTRDSAKKRAAVVNLPGS